MPIPYGLSLYCDAVDAGRCATRGVLRPEDGPEGAISTGEGLICIGRCVLTRLQYIISMERTKALEHIPTHGEVNRGMEAFVQSLRNHSCLISDGASPSITLERASLSLSPVSLLHSRLVECPLYASSNTADDST